MSFPSYTEAEARSRETFMALMWAFSYPGRIQHLPGSPDALTLIAETLLDLETSYYTPDSRLMTTLAYTGAEALPVDQAAYHFYPVIEPADLATIRRAGAGTMLYPDEAATLIVGCSLGQGTQ